MHLSGNDFIHPQKYLQHQMVKFNCRKWLRNVKIVYKKEIFCKIVCRWHLVSYFASDVMPSDILSVTLESKKVQCPKVSAILDSEVYISFLFIEKNYLLRYFKYSFQAVR